MKGRIELRGAATPCMIRFPPRAAGWRSSSQGTLWIAQRPARRTRPRHVVQKMFEDKLKKPVEINCGLVAFTVRQRHRRRRSDPDRHEQERHHRQGRLQLQDRGGRPRLPRRWQEVQPVLRQSRRSASAAFLAARAPAGLAATARPGGRGTGPGAAGDAAGRDPGVRRYRRCQVAACGPGAVGRGPPRRSAPPRASRATISATARQVAAQEVPGDLLTREGERSASARRPAPSPPPAQAATSASNRSVTTRSLAAPSVTVTSPAHSNEWRCPTASPSRPRPPRRAPAARLSTVTGVSNALRPFRQAA